MPYLIQHRIPALGQANAICLKRLLVCAHLRLLQFIASDGPVMTVLFIAKSEIILCQAAGCERIERDLRRISS